MTTSLTAPAAKIVGSFVMQVDDPQAFAADPAVRSAIADAVAGVAQVPSEFVSVVLTVVGRRLSSETRRLAGSVEAKYTILLPATSSASPTAIGDTLAATSPSAMTARVNSAIERKVGAGKYSVTVTAMVAPVVEVFTTTAAIGIIPDAIDNEVAGPSKASGAAIAGALGGILGCICIGAALLCYSRRRAAKRSAEDARGVVAPDADNLALTACEAPSAYHSI